MAELTFRTNIRRDRWPRWMTGLHGYLTRVYADSRPDATAEERTRLYRIVRMELARLNADGMTGPAPVYAKPAREDGRGAIHVMRGHRIITTYYIE